MVEIICTSPFHIMTAFILKYVEFVDDEVGILLLDYSKDSDVLYEKLKKCADFSEVHYVHAKKIWKKYRLDSNILFKIKFLSSGHKILKEAGIDWKRIDTILYPYHDPFVFLLTRLLNINDLSFKSVYFDDGSAPYMDFSNVVCKKIGIIERLFGVPIKSVYPDYAFMYSPENVKPIENFKIIKIDIPRDKEFIDKLNDFYDYTPFPQRKFIYFDQCTNQVESEQDKLEISKALEILDKYFDKKEVYVKKHPKRSSSIYEDEGWDIMPVAQYTPFELCVLNDSNFDEVMLVSDYSSACLTPKLLFDAEPNILFLYKVMPFFHNNNKVKESVEQIKSIYMNKKVFDVVCLEDIGKIVQMNR